MPVLLLALGGGVALVLLLARRAPSAGEERSVPPDRVDGGAVEEPSGGEAVDAPPPDLVDGGAKAAGGGALAELGSGSALAGGAVLAGGALLSAGGALLGYQLTGDVGGAIVGGANWGAGTVANVGRVGGYELDQALGGERGSLTGVIAETAGGVVGGTLFWFGALAATSWFLTGALVYAVASVISDLNRLAYGQKGATRDFWAEFERLKALLMTELADNFPDETERERWAIPLADGFVSMRNELAFRAWMARGRGFLGLGTTDDRYHGRFGAERGYFVGVRGADGNLYNSPVPRSVEASYLALANAAPSSYKDAAGNEVGGSPSYQSFPAVLAYQWTLAEKPAAQWPDEWDSRTGTPVALPPPTWLRAQVEAWNARPYPPPSGQESPARYWFEDGSTPSESSLQLGSQTGVDVWQWYELASSPVYGQRTFAVDPLATALRDLGGKIANVAAWAEWHRTLHGAFVNDFGHSRAGRLDARFLGDPEEAECERIEGVDSKGRPASWWKTKAGGQKLTALRYAGGLFDSSGHRIEE